MNYDTQIIYGKTNNKQFSLDGWVYYRTPSGKPKRSTSAKGSAVNVSEEDFVAAKKHYEMLFDCKLDC